MEVAILPIIIVKGEYKYLYIFKTMEASQITIDIIILTLANPSNKSLSQKVVNFLDADDLRILS